MGFQLERNATTSEGELDKVNPCLRGLSLLRMTYFIGEGSLRGREQKHYSKKKKDGKKRKN